jgi:hypothetical protein
MAWVDKHEAATNFGTLEAAGRRARESGGMDVAVVLRYESPECEVALNPAYCVQDFGGRGQRMQI